MRQIQAELSKIEKHYSDRRFQKKISLQEVIIVYEALLSIREIQEIFKISNDVEQKRQLEFFFAKRLERIKQSFCFYTSIPHEKISLLCREIAHTLNPHNYYRYLIPSLEYFDDQTSLLRDKLESYGFDEVIISDDQKSLIPIASLSWIVDGDLTSLIRPYQLSARRQDSALTLGEIERLLTHSSECQDVWRLFQEYVAAEQESEIFSELKKLRDSLLEGSAREHGNGGTGTTNNAGNPAMEGIATFFEYWNKLNAEEKKRYRKLKGDGNSSRPLGTLLNVMGTVDGDCVWVISSEIQLILNKQQSKTTLYQSLQEAAKKLEHTKGSEKYKSNPLGIVRNFVDERIQLEFSLRDFLFLVENLQSFEYQEIYDRGHKIPFNADDIISFASFLRKSSDFQVENLCRLLKKEIKYFNRSNSPEYFKLLFSNHTAETYAAMIFALGEDYFSTGFFRLVVNLEKRDQIQILLALKNQLPYLIDNGSQLKEVLYLLNEEQCVEVLRIFSKKSSRLIFSLEDIHEIQSKLTGAPTEILNYFMEVSCISGLQSFSQRKIFFNRDLYDYLPDKRSSIFIRMFSRRERSKIFNIIEYSKVKFIINSAKDFNNLIEPLADDEIKEFIDLFSPGDLKKLIKCSEDFHLIFKVNSVKKVKEVLSIFSPDEYKKLIVTAQDSLNFLSDIPEELKDISKLGIFSETIHSSSDFNLVFCVLHNSSLQLEFFYLFYKEFNNWITTFTDLKNILTPLPLQLQKEVLQLKKSALSNLIISFDQLLEIFIICRIGIREILFDFVKEKFTLIKSVQQLAQILAILPSEKILLLFEKNNFYRLIQNGENIRQIFQTIMNDRKPVVLNALVQGLVGLKSVDLFIELLKQADIDKQILLIQQLSTNFFQNLKIGDLLEIITTLSSELRFKFYQEFRAYFPSLPGFVTLSRMVEYFFLEDRYNFLCMISREEWDFMEIMNIDSFIIFLYNFPCKYRYEILLKFKPQWPSLVANRNVQAFTKLLSCLSIEHYLAVCSAFEEERLMDNESITIALQTAFSVELAANHQEEIGEKLIILRCIYNALYRAQHRLFKKKSFIEGIKFKNPSFQMLDILCDIRKHPRDLCAVAWLLAEGQILRNLTNDVALFKKIYQESFIQSSSYSLSRITGKYLVSGRKLIARLAYCAIDLDQISQQGGNRRSMQIMRALANHKLMAWTSLKPIVNEPDLVFLRLCAVLFGFFLPLIVGVILMLTFKFLPPLVILGCITMFPLVGVFGTLFFLTSIVAILRFYSSSNREKNLAMLEKVVNIDISEVGRRFDSLTLAQITQILQLYYKPFHKQYSTLIGFFTLGLSCMHQSQSSAELLEKLKNCRDESSLHGIKRECHSFFINERQYGKRLYRCLVEVIAADNSPRL